jgi:hypothetical protein
MGDGSRLLLTKRSLNANSVPHSPTLHFAALSPSSLCHSSHSASSPQPTTLPARPLSNPLQSPLPLSAASAPLLCTISLLSSFFGVGCWLNVRAEQRQDCKLDTRAHGKPFCVKFPAFPAPYSAPLSFTPTHLELALSQVHLRHPAVLPPHALSTLFASQTPGARARSICGGVRAC